MLKLAGETDIGRERIGLIDYNPGKEDTGDLESGTKTITATAEASGTGNADYSQALTLTKPDDARLEVLRIAARLSVTIDSFDTAEHLYCRVYVDEQDANHLLFDKDWTSIGNKLDAVVTYSGQKATIFNLLKDGGEHTFYFFFWTDKANNAVISLVQLWEGVSGLDNNNPCIRCNHTGFIGLSSLSSKVGTGTQTVRVRRKERQVYGYIVSTTADQANVECVLVSQGLVIFEYSSVATDLPYLANSQWILRSEQ